MTAGELGAFIGKRAMWASPNGLNIAVKTVDARDMFGRIDVRITPAEGSGEAWVDRDSLDLEDA